MDSFRQKEEGAFTAEKVESNKAGIINKLKQKHTSLGVEADFSWLHIQKEQFNFDLREQQIAALEKVTTKQVNELFLEVFFKNPRRLNMKIHSHAHRDDTATREKS